MVSSCLRRGDAHLEVSPVRFRIGTKHGPMTPASYRIFTDAHDPDRRRSGTRSEATHRAMRNTVRRTNHDQPGRRDKRQGSRKSHRNRPTTRLGRARCRRSRTPSHRRRPANIGNRRMDEYRPRGRTAGACPRTSQAGAPDQTTALPPGRGRTTAPVQLPQGGALAIASAICSGVRSR